MACGPAVRANHGGDGGVDGPGFDADQQFPPIDGMAATCEKIDVLFVIDNSGSMDQEQANLIANFPGFIQVLDASGLDYRVGVTTSGRDYEWTMATPFGPIPQDQDGGDNGTLLEPASCNLTHKWIEKTDANPAAKFSCVANVGVDGPSKEMPLGAIRDAFEDRILDGTNVGFRRPDALLALVILTDENDCSYEQSVSLGFGQTLCQTGTEPVGGYISFLDQYTGHRSRWATAVIAGKGPGSCSSSFGNAAEATRLKEFVTATGANAVISSICDGDLSIGLGQALELFDAACGQIIF
jgi:hypothetical protein